MLSLDRQETQRLAIQRQLDAARTPAERNKRGQFATPSTLATDIFAYARTLLPPGVPVRFLDPALGTGSFLSALFRTFPIEQISTVVGYEIDADYAARTLELWQDTPLQLHVADFTRAQPPTTDDVKATLVICNPPYVRHHHIAKDEKQRLRQAVTQSTGLHLSGLAGLYCYFLCLAHQWMADNGIAAWLIPSEFMDVNYGKQVKQYLLEQVTLLRVHRFHPKELQFADALVSSTVIWFKNSPPPASHTVAFTYSGTVTVPLACTMLPIDSLRTTAKWTQFPLPNTTMKTKGVSEAKRGEPTGEQHFLLADLFEIKRGIATGANKFFLLTQEQVRTYQLPAEFLVPVLPSPRYLLTNEVEADQQGNPLLDRKHFLLACDLDEEAVRANYPSLWKYFQLGQELGVHLGYLCRHRTPWYAQEKRPAPLFLCTYMGRQHAEGHAPFRFLLNHSQAIATNVYLLLYPKPLLQQRLVQQPELIKRVWQYLNAISATTLLKEGRVYGDGLHKLEPKELAHVSLDRFPTHL